MFRILPAVSILVLVIGCGGADSSSALGSGKTEESGGGRDEAVSTSSGARGEYTPEKGTATIKGIVKFEGKPPRRRPIDMGAEKFCVNCYAEGAPAQSETVLVGPGGGLANVFVQIKFGLRGWKFPKPEGEVLLDQSQCRYEPHMVGLRVGQKLRVRNSDPILHNVHALPFKGSRDIFNLAQTQQGQEDLTAIRRPGLYIAKCEVHGWMSSYIGVTKHPFFAVTKDDGVFTLAKVPPGEYTVEAWHEKYGPRTQKLKLGDGETAEITFTFAKK